MSYKDKPIYKKTYTVYRYKNNKSGDLKDKYIKLQKDHIALQNKYSELQDKYIALQNQLLNKEMENGNHDINISVEI